MSVDEVLKINVLPRGGVTIEFGGLLVAISPTEARLLGDRLKQAATQADGLQLLESVRKSVDEATPTAYLRTPVQGPTDPNE